MSTLQSAPKWASVAALVAVSAPVFAQSAAEDIGRKFAAQSEFKQSQPSCPTGQVCRSLTTQKTYRGLAVVPGSADLQDTTQLTTSDLTEDTVTTVEYAVVPDYMQVNVRIEFDFDSAVLRDDQKPKLSDLCLGMHDAVGARFQIIGHTDAVGSDDYNMRLSLLRAEEVKRHLTRDCGIQSTRLDTMGLGEAVLLRPDAPRADENRRVEFQVSG